VKDGLATKISGKNEGERGCPQNTQNTADTEKDFFICVHLRRLRASLDSVAALLSVISVLFVVKRDYYHHQTGFRKPPAQSKKYKYRGLTREREEALR
jgi:hypothetical protein